MVVIQPLTSANHSSRRRLVAPPSERERELRVTHRRVLPVNSAVGARLKLTQVARRVAVGRCPSMREDRGTVWDIVDISAEERRFPRTRNPGRWALSGLREVLRWRIPSERVTQRRERKNAG